MQRCEWANGSELEAAYHDEEWGVPEYDDTRLFEMLTLEGAQAGLSWSTILKKRDNYRRAFDSFDLQKVAAYDAQKVQSLLQDAGIVRHRLKIKSVISNAGAVLAIQQTHGSFSDFVWSFVNHRPIDNHWHSHEQVPSNSAASDAMSRSLKKLGFSFVGSTICYAFMQAVGMVNDHTTDCFRHSPLSMSR